LVRSPAVGARPRDHAARPPAEPEGIDGSSFEESLGLASLAHAPSSELASIVGAPTVEGGLVCRDAADVIVARDDRRESGYPLHLERFGRDVRLGSRELADAVLSPAESHPLLGEAADVEGPHRELDEGAGVHPSRLGAVKTAPAPRCPLLVERAGLAAPGGEGPEADESRHHAGRLRVARLRCPELPRVVSTPAMRAAFLVECAGMIRADRELHETRPAGDRKARRMEVDLLRLEAEPPFRSQSPAVNRPRRREPAGMELARADLREAKQRA